MNECVISPFFVLQELSILLATFQMLISLLFYFILSPASEPLYVLFPLLGKLFPAPFFFWPS